MKKSGRLKAIDIKGINAAMFMSPRGNGLTCFDFAGFNGDDSIHAGDILASSGHVIIIASAGKDPFGVSQFTKESDCTLSQMASSRFNFEVLQSSPVKNGIGIDRMNAADYVPLEPPMEAGLLEHAVKACLAHVRGAAVTTVKSKNASLVRHDASSACVDQEVALDHQDCVASCPVPSGALPEDLH